MRGRVGRKEGVTQKNAMATGLNPLSKRIIGCAWTVANTLGCGVLERACENALAGRRWWAFVLRFRGLGWLGES